MAEPVLTAERLVAGYVPEVDILRGVDLTVPSRREAMLELFPRLAERARVRAGALSGGERQLLAIARTLMAEPRVLLLDEPSAGVAPIFVDLIFDKIAEVNRAGVTVLMVEQNARRALAMSHRGYVLDVGTNRFEGSGAELLADPRVVDLYLGGSGRIDRPPRLTRRSPMAIDYVPPTMPSPPYRALLLGSAMPGWYEASDSERSERLIPRMAALMDEREALGARLVASFDDDLFIAVCPPGCSTRSTCSSRSIDSTCWSG